MKIFYILIILALFSRSSFSQNEHSDNPIGEIEILNTDSLIKGIYLSFKEFQQNNPTLRVDYIISDTIQPYYYYINMLQYKKIYIPDSTNSLVEFKMKHWGICDGKNAFINYNGKYLELSIDGKYCQFSDLPRYKLTNNTLPFSTIEYYDYALNITNGEIIPVEVYTVKELLKNENIILYMEFKKDKYKKNLLCDYIKRLSKSYSNK